MSAGDEWTLAGRDAARDGTDPGRLLFSNSHATLSRCTARAGAQGYPASRRFRMFVRGPLSAGACPVRPGFLSGQLPRDTRRHCARPGEHGPDLATGPDPGVVADRPGRGQEPQNGCRKAFMSARPKVSGHAVGPRPSDSDNAAPTSRPCSAGRTRRRDRPIAAQRFSTFCNQGWVMAVNDTVPIAQTPSGPTHRPECPVRGTPR
jgi:hypothetical protein